MRRCVVPMAVMLLALTGCGDMAPERGPAPVTALDARYDPQVLEARILEALVGNRMSYPEQQTSYSVTRLAAHRGPSRTLFMFEVQAVTTDMNRPGWKREAVATGTYNPQNGDVTRLQWRTLSDD